MVDSTGTYSWTFDNANRVTALNTPQGNLSYTFNNDNSKATMVQSAGTTTYSYDDAGRLTSLANPFSETTTWAYDNANRVTRQTFNTGAYTAYGYDSRNRLTSLDHKNSSNAGISAETYAYDDASNLTSKTVDSVTTSYGYDEINQLTSESRSGYSASYTYDNNGNRATMTLGGVTDTYSYTDQDELDHITRSGSTIKSYGYDDAGRTTSVTVGANTTTLAYDYEGRLTTITFPNSSTNTFTYNALDTRVGKVDSGGTFTYKRDGVGVTAPVLADGAATFTPGISERRSSTTKFYHEDQIGSVTRILNTSQSTTDTKQFDAFGNLVSSTGSTATPFGFAGGFGYQEDGDSGLKLLGHRLYEPSTSRFLVRDRQRDGRNWYAYCESNPFTKTDPEGLRWIYVISTGQLYWDPLGDMGLIGGPISVGTGYSGREGRPTFTLPLIGPVDRYPNKPGRPRNNPLWVDVPNAGPIPPGDYTIGPPHGGRTGPFTLSLDPKPANHMYARDLFAIHGDNSRHDASEGCIILPRPIRELIRDSHDDQLTVEK